MIYANQKTGTPLTTGYANVSLDLVGSCGFAAIDAVICEGVRTEAELFGGLRTLQRVEDRFIVGATGGFIEETF